ncbi:hypothetical protein [Plasmodium yoelii yoelii]|uniref:Uncharacterized protein n=1 Tax=Plasmodium yoelii yoelii TaxID=73239 RepID=Q7RDV4_PLAYO|nr:hypothetical protein [Plasmodium yoelii yoelii]
MLQDIEEVAPQKRSTIRGTKENNKKGII